MAETLNLQIPSPTFEGSTGGWLRAAEVGTYPIDEDRICEHGHGDFVGEGATRRQEEELAARRVHPIFVR